MMAWEHLVLGNGIADLRTECGLLAELGRDPRDVDPGRVRDRYPGVEPLRLPGSGVVVTVGELNVLADYFSHPDGIAAAPARFMLPLVQSVRAQSLVQLRRVMGQHRGAQLPSARIPGALRYSRQRRMSELREGIAITMAGRRGGLAEWELYPSVIARNAAHFAPFSWYRWQAFHLDAREMIVRSDALPSAERERLRGKARLYAGYADHFLQDSFAAGHLANKTLVMQWYAEWVTRREGWRARRWPALTATTWVRQPLLHGPSLYYPQADPAADRMSPSCARTGTDPQTMVEVASLEGRIRASGVTGVTPAERQAAYLAYLALLNDPSAQFAAGVVHGYFNRRSLTVASQPEGPTYRIWGDRTMFTPGPTVSAGAAQAAAASRASRQAISELLATGRTVITTREIFERFPRHVQTGRGLVSLPQWHQSALRDLCLRELFGRWDTRAARLATAFWPRRSMSSWTRHAMVPMHAPEVKS
jgi:hypothetical protein